MKSRVKEEGVALDPRFVEFGDFLTNMGPKPHTQDTLDRFPKRDGPYTLENVRWADKRTQANNRKNTRFVLHDGEMLPATEVARRTGQKPDTVRKRYTRAKGHLKSDGNGYSEMARKAQNAAVQARRLDPYRWVDADERSVRFWASLYQHGEDEWFGTTPVTLRLRSPSDGALRDETFVEFMVRMDGEIINALTTGDLTDLPNLVADKLAGSDYDRRRQFEISTARLAWSFKASLEAKFSSDPLVDDKLNFACDISWMDQARAKLNGGILAREAQNRFRSANVALPESLVHVLTDLSRLPLGRRNIKP